MKTESGASLLCDAIASIVGPSRLALMDAGCLWLLPSLLMSEMIPVVVAHGGAAALGPELHGVSCFPDVTSVSDELDLAACLFSDSTVAARGIPRESDGCNSMLVVVPADFAESSVQALRDEVAIRGWGQHPRQSAARHQGETLLALGYRMLAFARPGLAAVRPDQRARISRIELLSDFVRRGDRALVVARDVSPGSALLASLAQASSIEGIHPRELAERAKEDTGFDFVLFEMDQNPGDENLVAALGQRLSKSGRLAIVLNDCAPDVATEIVSTLPDLQIAIEQMWAQRRTEALGGAPEAGTYISTIDPREICEAASYLILGMSVSDSMPVMPGAGGAERRLGNEVPNIVAFERDYDDPAIVRLIVAIGLRSESPGVRRAIALGYLQSAAFESADFGAALCVLCYEWLADRVGLDADRLLEQGRRYLSLVPANPTAFRWQVSVAFAMALVCQRLGRREDTASFHRFVVSQDVLKFSPLLGTKTIASLLALAWSAYAEGNLAQARELWTEGVMQARRLATFDDWSEVIGSLDAPETFGMPELSSILDEAGKAVSALRVSSSDPHTRGKVWQAANQSQRARLRRMELTLAGNFAWLRSLQESKDWLVRQCESLARSLQQAQMSLSDQQAASVALQEGKDWLAEQHELLSRAYAKAQEALAEQQVAGLELQKGKDWLAEQYEQLSVAYAQSQDVLAAQQAANVSLQAAKDWLEGQYHDLLACLETAQSDFRKLQDDLSDLQAGKDWLEGEYRALLARCGDVETRLAAVRDRSDAVAQRRIRRLEALAVRRLRTALESHLSAETSLETAYGHLLSTFLDAWREGARRVEDPDGCGVLRVTAWSDLQQSALHLVDENHRQWEATASLMDRIERRLSLGDTSRGSGELLQRLERIAHLLDAVPFPRLFLGIYAWVGKRVRSKYGR